MKDVSGTLSYEMILTYEMTLVAIYNTCDVNVTMSKLVYGMCVVRPTYHHNSKARHKCSGNYA